MFCAKCGSKLEEEARFCTKCGAPIDESRPEEGRDEDGAAPCSAGAPQDSARRRRRPERDAPGCRRAHRRESRIHLRSIFRTRCTC